MKTVIAVQNRYLVSLSASELVALANCTNEVLNNSSLDEHDCHSRIGVEHRELIRLQQEISAAIESKKLDDTDLFEVWRDGESVQIRAVSVFGDPADLGFEEFRSKVQPILDEEKFA